jgi:hypothetical protein
MKLMRKALLPLSLVAVIAVGCSSDSGSSAMQRYYDPAGLFSAQLPRNNDILVMPSQNVAGSLPLLGGVLAVPSTPTPSPSSGPFGGGNFIQPVTQEDTSVYSVFAVRAKGISSMGDLATSLLADTANPQVVSQRLVRVMGRQGLLVIADHSDQGVGYSDASLFLLDGDLGYWIREFFGLGEWDKRRDQFFDLLRSFRPGVPPGITAVSLSRPGLLVESAIGWPVG